MHKLILTCSSVNTEVYAQTVLDVLICHTEVFVRCDLDVLICLSNVLRIRQVSS